VILKKYSEFKPSAYDRIGLGLQACQNWLVAPTGRNRDSDCLTESNWECQLGELRAVAEDGEGQPEGPEDNDAQWFVASFNHWACGWFEIVLVRPGSEAHKVAEDIARRLEDYPVLDEDDFGDRERTEADRVWSECYDTEDRIEYIRENREQFEFSSLADMLSCVRGNYFAGYPGELLS
jgi:hypothetical protein